VHVSLIFANYTAVSGEEEQVCWDSSY